MDLNNLIRMANQIGEFFQSQPDAEQASQELSQHLRKFWAPRMRSTLLAHLDSSDGAGLLPFVSHAMRAHRAALQP